MRCLYFLLGFLIALLSNVSCDQAAKEKYISATLFTKWSETPLLLEAGEFIHRNNPNYFWPFVNEISQSTLFANIESSKLIIFHVPFLSCL